MNILLDNIIFDLQRVGGISIYWKELLKRIFRTGDIDLYCIDKEKIESNFIFQELVNEIDYNRIKKITPYINHRYVPLILQQKYKKFIFHSSYYRPLIDRSSKKVVTVHDFMYEKFDKGIKRKIHTLQKKIAIQNADVVVCISESTKKDLLFYFPEYRNKDIRVIYNGVGNHFRQLNEDVRDCKYLDLLSSKKYLLVVGNRVGCKNFETTIKAYKKLYQNYDLVVVGSSLTEKEKMLLGDVLERVHIYTNVDDESLNHLYNAAFALIFPSLYEGFGIPIIEAMKAGCPVITTEFSSIPEVAGNAGVYMKSNDAESVIAAIRLLEDSVYHKDIVNKGIKNATRFSWDNTYNELFKIYTELYEKM